ncbi:hypothetical protein [Burkholderia glumae]|uniref:Uncharacterized protein n=3 Tax=Burkholderia glumae TaxID=337 RepID=A0AAQ0BT62_BURGL|nr:hypothetical protein [Burkholderia glumae]MCM2484409.1 hypothetical protein [Burkholderia glumae]MCM2510101.1 hypothetical protein [Burkholderia glumae]MCM2539863.1 hypothetical protein [Burkholderia glumae]QGA39635.1 hypothetical protein GAS19_18570 [Burkholderia glumae]QPQ91421.1 hypothetical protein I6H06_05810 [Burkholderia glumae]
MRFARNHLGQSLRAAQLRLALGRTLAPLHREAEAHLSALKSREMSVAWLPSWVAARAQHADRRYRDARDACVEAFENALPYKNDIPPEGPAARVSRATAASVKPYCSPTRRPHAGTLDQRQRRAIASASEVNRLD